MLAYGTFTKKERLFKGTVMTIMAEKKLPTITAPEPTFIQTNAKTFTDYTVDFGSGPQ